MHKDTIKKERTALQGSPSGYKYLSAMLNIFSNATNRSRTSDICIELPNGLSK